MDNFNLNSLDEKEAFMLYEVFNSLIEQLQRKDSLNKEDQITINNSQNNMLRIEEWSKQKRKEELNWTKEEILKNYGSRPTLILLFYPASNAYEKYGQKIVVNINFNENELIEMLENISNNSPRKPGIIRFKIIDDQLTDGEVNTSDIFEITGRK